MSRKRKSTNDDLEPTVKLLSGGDVLLKKLVEKQLSKKVNLQQELSRKEEFVTFFEHSALTDLISGTNSLGAFQSSAKYVETVAHLKVAGFSKTDIDYYLEFQEKGIDYVAVKHKNLEPSYLKQRINDIDVFLKSSKVTDSIPHENSNNRRQVDEMLSIKPNSLETSLLKFALENERTKNKLPSAMDNIMKIESELMNSFECTEITSVSKIQKKLRKMKSHLDSMNCNIREPSNSIQPNTPSMVLKTNWDLKTSKSQTLLDKNISPKLYSCAQQNIQNNLYTIRDGQIIKLNGEKNEITPTQTTKLKKISLEEIKLIPRFADYKPGLSSNILYLKNMNNVCREDIESIFESYNFQPKSIRILTGRMRGQAFIEMMDIEAAENALSCLNGIILNNKPIIVEFGKK